MIGRKVFKLEFFGWEILNRRDELGTLFMVCFLGRYLFRLERKLV